MSEQVSENRQPPVVELSTPELAYLLMLMQTPRVVGGDNQALYPADQAAQEALWAEGKRQLEASGRMVWDEDEKAYHLDRPMEFLLIEFAYPLAVLQCEIARSTEQPTYSYAIGANAIVQFALRDQRYFLRFVPSAEAMVAELSELLDLPETRQNELRFALSTQRLQAAQSDPTILSEFPPAFRASLRQLRMSALISLFQVRESQLTGMRNITLFQQDEWLTWQAVVRDPSDPDLLDLQASHRAQFAASLQEQLALILEREVAG
jgi:hypothetical protein